MDGSAPTDSHACPNEEILKAILNLQSDDDLTRQVREHLNQCPSCQIRLDQLTSSPELKAVHKSGNVGWGESARKLVSEIAKEFSHKLGDEHQKEAQFAETLHIAGDTEVSHDGSEDELNPPIQNLPKTIGRYSVLKELGRGGSGVVYLTFDPKINRKVALKRIHSTSDGQKRRLVREAKAAAKLQIDQVVRIYSIESDNDGSPFVTMEFVDGQSLADEIQHSRYLSTERAVEVCVEVATAVQSAHDSGILHRDIKPGNILIEKNGNAKLTDFGLAHLGESFPQLTKTGVLLGTPAYMSPEQAIGTELDSRSDVYSLGCVLYESLTGSMPFYGTTHQVLRQIADEQPVSMLQLNENIPRELHLICCKAMAKRPENRYGTAADFRNDLTAALNGDAITARPETAFQAVQRWYNKNKTIAWLSTAIATLLVVTTIVSLVSVQKISRESQKAIQASEKSKRSAIEADKQRSIAVATLNELVFDIQNKLKGKPGTIQVKQAILENALKGLRKVVVDGDSTLSIDHANCTAFLRMADIELARGNNKASVDYYEKARQIAQKVSDEHPDQIQGRIDLGNAMLGLADAKITGFQFAEAIKDYQKVLTLRKSIADVEPSAENQFDHARIHGRMGAALSALGRYSEAAKEYETSLELMSPFQDEIQNDPIFARSFAVANSGLANQLVLTKQLARAEKHLKTLIDTNSQLLKLDGFNSDYLLDAAVALGQMTQIHVQRYDWEKANQFAIETRKMHERIVKLNPENAWSRSNMGLSWSTEALTFLALNDLASAETAWQQDLQIQQVALEENPNNVRFLLPAAEAAVYLAGIGIRNGDLQSTFEYAGLSDSLLAKIPESMVESNALVQRALIISSLLSKSSKMALEHLDNSIRLDPMESDSQKYALALVAYQYVADDQFEQAIESAESIVVDSFDSEIALQYTSYLLAATYAKLLAIATENTERQNQKQLLVEKAIEFLDNCVSSQGELQMIMSDPDFLTLRSCGEFDSAVERWSSSN